MNRHLALFVMLMLVVAASANAGASSSQPAVLSASGEILTSSGSSSSSEGVQSEAADPAEEAPAGRPGDRVGASITPGGARTVLRELESKDLPLIDELCVHEGPMDNAYAHWLANDIFAVSYTAPLYPAVIESVQIYILSEGDLYWPWPDSIHQPFVILLFDDGGGQPGTEIFRDTVVADDVPPSWVVAYPNVVINSGDFWVGTEQFDDNPNCEGIGVDSSYDNGAQNWWRIGGVWTQDPGLTGDLMMCAFVSTLVDTSRVIFSGNSIMPPAIDGVIDSVEWAEATMRDVSDLLGVYDLPDPWGSAWLYVKNDETNLYMALDALVDMDSDDYDDFSPYFDDNNDDRWPAAPDSNEGNFWFNSMSSGADSVIWRYWQTGPVAGVQRTVPFQVGVSLSSGHQQFEGVVPFGVLPEELQALPRDTVGFFLLAYESNGSDLYSWWPYDVSDFTDPSLYGDLVLAPGFPPVLNLAEASDNMDSIPGIDPDDFVLLLFDEPTNKPAIDWSNIDNVFQLSGGHTWLDEFGNIGSALWNAPGDRLMITLSTTIGPPTVAVGDTITPDGVTVMDLVGNPCVSPIEITGSFGEPTGVEELKARVARPGVYTLSQSSPNPFYEETEIRYTVPVKSEISLRIYDLTGRAVKTLVHDEVEQGTHFASWDGSDELGSSVPAGVYLYRLAAGDFVSARKLVLLR